MKKDSDELMNIIAHANDIRRQGKKLSDIWMAKLTVEEAKEVVKKLLIAIKSTPGKPYIAVDKAISKDKIVFKHPVTGNVTTEQAAKLAFDGVKRMTQEEAGDRMLVPK